MGGSSSSSNATSNYSSVDNSITYTDLGAIEAGTSVSLEAMELAKNSLDSMALSNDSAFEFGSKAFDFSDGQTGMALQAMQDFGNNALEKVADSYQESDAQTMQEIFKYSAITAGIFAAAIVMRGK